MSGSATRGVSTSPGATALRRMPAPAHSSSTAPAADPVGNGQLMAAA